MPIYINNSLTRKKEEFKPQSPPEVKMYTCGVTVYDDCHIGHARSLYIFDVIKNYLRYRGYKVKFIRNITDIDDKIINKAKESSISAQEVARRYTESYQKDLELLGIDTADNEPKATENIKDMIKHIEGLINKGYAYESAGDVYFSVRKFKDYGKLSGQSLDQMMVGTRKEPGEHKIDPLDFALWKKSKENEPSWASPWGKGRPGWHIECSVMSQKFLKTDTLDIHGGEALTGKTFAKYWIHHGLLTINGQKMAKSLGNFVTVKKFIEEYKYADILKLFFLSTHYSQPIDYTNDKIEEFDQRLKTISLLMGKIDEKLSSQRNELKLTGIDQIKEIKNKFLSAMDNDFNTPEALATISDLIKITNKNIDDLKFISESRSLWVELAKILGLDYTRKDVIVDVSSPIPISSKVLSPKISVLSKERDKARKRGDFKEADRIRKELEEQGFILEDGKDGKTTLRKKL